MLIIREVMHVWRKGIYGKSLYFPLNFTANLKIESIKQLYIQHNIYIIYREWNTEICLNIEESHKHTYCTIAFILFSSIQSLSHVRLWDPMNCSSPGLPVHHQLLEFTYTHVHWVSDAIQPSHPLLSPSPPALNLAQHQGLFQWVSSSHQVAKVLEFQLQNQSHQWTLRTDLL